MTTLAGTRATKIANNVRRLMDTCTKQSHRVLFVVGAEMDF